MSSVCLRVKKFVIASQSADSSRDWAAHIMQKEKGKLVRWIDEKGFGFIKPEIKGSDLFIHVSALRGMNRKPVVGDVILYQTGFDKNGKLRAINATIEGVPKQLTLEPLTRKRDSLDKPARKERPYQRSRAKVVRPQKSLGSLFFLLVIVGGIYAYDKLAHRNPSNVSVPMDRTIVEQPIAPAPRFQCQGKVYCSEMTSIEEAYFYLQNCPGTKMDGDGIPCERQF